MALGWGSHSVRPSTLNERRRQTEIIWRDGGGGGVELATEGDEALDDGRSAGGWTEGTWMGGRREMGRRRRIWKEEGRGAGAAECGRRVGRGDERRRRRRPPLLSSLLLIAISLADIRKPRKLPLPSGWPGSPGRLRRNCAASGGQYCISSSTRCECDLARVKDLVESSCRETA